LRRWRRLDDRPRRRRQCRTWGRRRTCDGFERGRRRWGRERGWHDDHDRRRGRGGGVRDAGDPLVARRPDEGEDRADQHDRRECRDEERRRFLNGLAPWTGTGPSAGRDRVFRRNRTGRC
jgi:hypothetical protein